MPATRTVSIITPVAPHAAEFLASAYASIRQQDLPPGWTFEWLVQQDGEDGDVAPLLPPGDPRVLLSRGRHAGAATARNLALARARGEVVKVLDADDQLTEGALLRDLTTLQTCRDVHWTTSRVLDLLPDGTIHGFDHDPPPGPIRPGDVIHHWHNHDYRASVHPATLCVRTDLLLMLGGWMALPASEDTGLLLALNAVSFGYFLPEVGLLYRKWPGQASASAGHLDPVEREARMALISRRAAQLRDAPSPIRDAVLDTADPC